MKLRYRIIIILMVIGVAIPVSFIPLLHISQYFTNSEYVSTLPTVDVIGAAAIFDGFDIGVGVVNNDFFETKPSDPRFSGVAGMTFENIQV